MKILHITPHLGGGIGTVVMGWMDKVGDNHSILCLDYVNAKAARTLKQQVESTRNYGWICMEIEKADIVLVNFWDHPMLEDLLNFPLPDCRLVFWCHKNYPVPQKYLDYPDLFIDTSPVQGHGRHIWSTGGVDMFLEIQPKAHEGFNIGYIGTVDYKKMHKDTLAMCYEIGKMIPDVHFTFVGGGDGLGRVLDDRFTFTGKVDDVAPYLAEMDVFGYPLRSDHYGTCEQAIGEAMAAGVIPVVMNNPAEREIIIPGITGIISNSIEHYIDSFDYLKHRNKIMPEECRHRARYLYSIDKMVNSWNEVFNEMMENPKRSHE